MSVDSGKSKKMLAAAIIAVLTLSVLSLSMPVLSQDEGDEEEREEEAGDEEAEKTDEEKEEDAKEEAEEDDEAEEESEVEVKAEVGETSSIAEVEVKFTSPNTDKESLMQEILDRVRLDAETVSSLLKMETEEEEEFEAKLEVKVKIEDGKAEVEFEYEFVVDATERDAIVTAIVEKLQALELDDIQPETEVKSRAEEKAKEAKERAEKAAEKAKERTEKSVKEAKERAETAAEKAREAAEAKGKPEFVENIADAKKFFGKSGKAVVGLKIGLESEDIESMSFGSAHLLLIKVGDKEPMFRAVINVLTDQPVETLTACLDGEAIGELTIVPTDEELGLSIGHMRATLTGMSITIPGTFVDIVEGTNCAGTPILSGSI